MDRTNHLGEIFAVKVLRAFNDPLLAYDPDSTPGNQSLFKQVVPLDRLQLVLESEDTERVELASWAEIAIYCSSASLVNQAWARGSAANIYKYAFKQVLDTWGTELPNNDLEQSLGLDSIELTDQEKRKAGKLRRKLKRQRDKQFLDNAYSDMGLKAPKAVWKGGPQVGKLADATSD